MGKLAGYIIPKGNPDIWERLQEHDHEQSYGLHFFGPAGVGRRTFAHRYHLARNPVDGNDFNFILDASVATLRSVVPSMSHPPKMNDRTLALRFTEELTADQVSAVVSLLELETKTKIIVITDFELPEALSSRLTEFRFKRLTDGEVSELMKGSRAKFSPESIQRAIKFADGIAARATAFRGAAAAQDKVAKLLHAISEKDFRAITVITSRNDASRVWSENCTRELQRWLKESITGKWDIFSPDEEPKLTKNEQMLLYHASTRPIGVSAKIRIAAESIARGEVNG